jgi:hypothetical protein
MKHVVRNFILMVLGIGFAGCEWGGSGDDNSWNDSGAIANFNGSYRGGGSGGYLVSVYSTASSSTPGGTATISGESIGTGDGSSTTFGGTLTYAPVVAGSLSITAAGGFSFSDAGDGTLNGSVSGTSGTIAYPSGGWTINLGGGFIAAGGAITATYTVTNAGSSSSGSSQGSTDPIYAFNVQQSGNKIKIIDNNGSVYEGSMGDMRTTGNLGSGSSGGTYVNGDQVIASFSASGKSAAGMFVNLTGSFQGTVQGVSSVTTTSGSTTTTKTSMALANRRIVGTWIEDGGKTGDISGVSDSAVNVSTSSTGTTGGYYAVWSK